MSPGETLDEVLAELRACRICRDARSTCRPCRISPPGHPGCGDGRLCIAGQAPGTRPCQRPAFTDPSGVRLRSWLGIDEALFYDAAKVAIVPMGFCFPGLDAKGGDKPPRRECAPTWRAAFSQRCPGSNSCWRSGAMPRAGISARRKRPISPPPSLTGAKSSRGRAFRASCRCRPSWRNNAWLKRNPWFEEELLPVLRQEVGACCGSPDAQ
jgi:uracil-DNA glycosylase